MNTDTTLLVIGAGSYQRPLIEYAAKHYRMVLAAPSIPDDLACLAARSLICDVRDKDKILQFAQAERVHGVVTDQTDIPVRTVAYVAEQMHLPGIGMETATLFTNKALMREKQLELGLPVLRHSVTARLEDAIAFCHEIGKPVIIKPLDNQGSRGVQTVESDEEMRQKFPEASKYSSSGEVLIDQMAKGREFVVEGLVLKGEYKTLICGDTYYFTLPDVFAATMRCFPSVADARLVEKVIRRNQEIITGFGLSQGITHSEFICDDEVYLLETAARGGGVFISSDMISLSTGLNTEAFLCNIALGKQSSMPDFQNGTQSCGYMAFYLPEGEVVSINGVSEVKALPYVHRNLLDQIRIGMTVAKSCDKTSRYSIVVSAENRGELFERMDKIRAMLKIQTKTINGMELPIWK